jgi:hypothetical protein
MPDELFEFGLKTLLDGFVETIDRRSGKPGRAMLA